VRKSTEQQLAPKETADINNLKTDQNDLAKRLNASARNGSEIINEAAKNPFFVPKTLTEFASSLSEIKKTSTGSMRDSENKLNDAASSNVSEASKSMMQSAESQERALEELRKVLAKFAEQLDRLEARTLAQRLTKLEKTENKLSIKLVSIMPSSVGKMPSQLDNKNLSSFYEMEKAQTRVSEDADEVKNEISRYHERTQKAEYGKVSRLMEEANLKEGLTRVAQNIRNNISFHALENLDYWENSFEKWAKLLQQESPGGDSPAGQGEGKDRRADILALMKMRKTQSDILFKTKTLDQEGFRGNKRVWSLSLNDQQNTLMIDLTDTQISLAEEALNPLFDDAHMAMSESSEQLSKEIFDKRTQAAQQESKDIISDLINLLVEGQGKGQGRSDNENLSAMELLMMQMGNQQKGMSKGNSPTPGNTGGGSSQGGSVDQVTKTLEGSSLAPTKNDSSSKSSSNITPSIAPEFQDAMQKYFKAIED
jgi:DNA-directed RNA polymerase subunit F